jgi:hypothetical protein
MPDELNCLACMASIGLSLIAFKSIKTVGDVIVDKALEKRQRMKRGN